MFSFIPNLDGLFSKKSFKSLALTAALVSTLGLNVANAQTVGPGCDPAFMKSMQQKAWMEAQREIMIAQATIAKPDSVFSLGCFGNFTSGYSGTINFTNGTSYNYSSAVSNYISAAFGHSYGGAHYSGAGSNSANNSNCADMKNLWNAAHADNLAQPSRTLDTLQDIASFDRGAYPTAASAPSSYGAAGSAGTPLGTFYGAKVASKSVGATFDDMSLFSGVTAPQSQLGSSAPPLPPTCSAGIKTGISVDAGGTAQDEIICPNPGCASNGASPPKCCDYSGGNCSS